jgi:hypothetical protein
MLGMRVDEVPYVCGARFSGESKTGGNAVDYVHRGRKYVETVLALAGERVRGSRSDRV